jgi:hypothetical protein
MLKKDIEELRTKATSFLRVLDGKAKDMNITLVSLVDGEMIFMDNDSGVQVKCSLVTDVATGTVESVPSAHSVGEPTIKLGPPKKPH